MPSQNYEGVGWHKWTVPDGVKHVDVIVEGAGSGGRRGGAVTGRIAVSKMNELHIFVGQQGDAANGSTGGNPVSGGGGSGGNGGGGKAGGGGGGGASYIRRGARDGTVLAVAGGAGGRSGDGGEGGEGGAGVGENGYPGTEGENETGNATGGTQESRGYGGTSSAGADFYGGDAATGFAARGGHGGQSSTPSHGGGGGGGGYRSGGGGQASSVNYSPGGGGGGGSNYTGGLSSPSSERGAGNLTNGRVNLQWFNTEAENQPPTSPTNLKIGGDDEANALVTRAMKTIGVSAELNDPNKDTRLRLQVRYSATSDFRSFKDVYSDYVERGKRASVTLTGLDPNTRYYLRAWTQERKTGKRSQTYNAANFWTNRPPVPVLLSPEENSQFSPALNMTFDWQFTDPDGTTSQSAYQFRYRIAATPGSEAGPWVVATNDDAGETLRVVPADTFRSNTFYEWSVRVKDPQGLWGSWVSPFSFYTIGTSTPPRRLNPRGDEAVVVTNPVTFRWTFVDPSSADGQCSADLRYRVAGTQDWVTVIGDETTPGTLSEWTFADDVFAPGFRYEYQIRTYDGGPTCVESSPSDWSESAFFHAIREPGWAVPDPVIPETTVVRESLGCGDNRVYLYAQGGEQMIGEIDSLELVRWERRRDDISSSLIRTSGFGSDCANLLRQARSWMHELVIFRNGQRVWEGPISRIAYERGSVEIEAKDVMNYLYRRILRQGYNDTHQIVNGEQLGLRTVVERAQIIAQNALAPYDPNVLPFLTVMTAANDARQSRNVPDFTVTAWEEIDDLAATGGLDYTVVGRRILFWDTHKPIGKLAEMRDGDFSDSPIVTEYGMQYATTFAVTNNAGVYGLVHARDFEGNVVRTAYTGPVELLASAYGETAAASSDTLTPAARAALQETLARQAARNISGRWPIPLVVRVPDNSALNPEANIDINHLVPGVWIPLHSTSSLREVTQWQKLDSMQVEQVAGDEKVRVVMSPAPDENRDPDADASADEA